VVDHEIHSHKPLDSSGILWAIVGHEYVYLEMFVLQRFDNEGFRRLHYVKII
jgi:hypothetical protein